MKKKVLAILPGLIPSTIIGIVKPLLIVSKKNHFDFKVTLTRTCTKNDIKNADVIIFCRNSEPVDLKFLYLAKELNKQIIYEIDDNFFEINTETPLGKYHRHPARLYVLKTFFELSDIIHVYSEPMFEIVSQYSNKAKLINSYFDFELINGIVQKKDSDKIKIVYATSRGSNDELGKTFENALLNVMDKYGELIEVYMWGNLPLKYNNRNNVFLLPYIRDYNKYVKFFYESGFDIGLAPLNNDLFHRSKTNNKFREYGACEICGVYSNVDVYSKCVRHLDTGIIVENTIDEWEKAISLLVENKQLREKIKQNALIEVQKNYSINKSVELWEDNLKNLELLKNDQKIINNYFIGNLQILLVIDKDNELIVKSRTSSLIEACVSFGVSFHIMYDIYFTGENETKYDVIIFFFSDSNSYANKEPLIEKLRKPVIIDFARSQSLELALINISEKLKFIVSEENIHGTTYIPSYTNLINLKDFVQLENVFYSLKGIPITNWLTTHSNGVKDLSKELDSIPKLIKQNEKMYYSLHSPLLEWMKVLSEYKGTKKFRLIKTPRFISIMLIKFNQFLDRYKRYANFIKKTYTTSILLMRINVFKKYK